MIEIIIRICIICLLTYLSLILVNKFIKVTDKIYLKFIKSFLKVFICIIAIIIILSNFEGFQTFSATILKSISLLVVVLGFAFKIYLTDFIA